MNIWNEYRTSMVNEMPASTQENDDHHSMQTTQQNSPTSVSKDKKKKFQDKMEGFLKHIVSNSSSLISSFWTTTYLLKNIDDHIATLVHKL